MSRSILLAIAIALFLPQQATLDRVEMERVEDLSESLANDLLALSVATRDRDEVAMAGHFAARVEATDMPVAPLEPQPLREWISQAAWSTTGREEPLTRAETIGRLRALLAPFDAVEDARFKVKEADFERDATRGSARVKMFVIGRGREGNREWLQAWLRVTASRVDEAAWQIEAMRFESVDSTYASVDVFSEVALPAGVAAAFPPFGTEPNDTVVAHGAAVADVDADGLMDVLTTGVERNRLYLNRGDGAFDDASAAALLDVVPPATGALFLDADGDGDEDLFLSAVGRQMFLENRLVPDGDLRFLDVSVRAGVALDAIGFSIASADVNGDARPDVYVTGYNRYGRVMPDSWHGATNGSANLLFLNDGNGRFREAAAEWGVRDTRWSYAAAFADIDRDGDPDLYVANDFGENALYLNEGDRFRDVGADRGVLDPGNGMGAAFGDFDNDGALDLHVTNMSSTAGNRILARLFPEAQPESSILKKLASGNTLFRGAGDGTFEDVTRQVGGFSGGWAWGGGFIDVDNDGWEDVYAPNGFISGKTMNDT